MSSQVTISGIEINQDDSERYCINDLHKAAGGEDKYKPSNWLRLQQAIDLIGLLTSEQSTEKNKPILIKQGLGTFVSKELVYAYAMWISPKFHLAVIRAYDEIRKNNQNLPALPTNFIEALEMLVQSEKEKQAAHEKIEADRPKVEFAMAVRNMQGSCAIGEFCKSIGWGRNKLLKQMRDDNILMRNNLPYQKFIDSELFVVIEQIPFTDSKGKNHPAFKTMITGKGQVWLEKKYRKDV